MFVITCSYFPSFALLWNKPLKHFSATQVPIFLRKAVCHKNCLKLLYLLLIQIRIYLMPRHFLWSYSYISLLLTWELTGRWKPLVVVVGVSGAVRGTAGLPLVGAIYLLLQADLKHQTYWLACSERVLYVYAVRMYSSSLSFTIECWVFACIRIPSRDHLMVCGQYTVLL